MILLTVETVEQHIQWCFLFTHMQQKFLFSFFVWFCCFVFFLKCACSETLYLSLFLQLCMCVKHMVLLNTLLLWLPQARLLWMSFTRCAASCSSCTTSCCTSATRGNSTLSATAASSDASSTPLHWRSRTMPWQVNAPMRHLADVHQISRVSCMHTALDK